MSTCKVTNLNNVIICWGTSNDVHSANGEEVTLPISYTTRWHGFGGPHTRDGNYNTTCIPACLYQSVSKAWVCNRPVHVTTSDQVDYLTIGY